MKPAICPPIRSWNAGAVPLYGTMRYSMPLGAPQQLGGQVAGRSGRADREGQLAGVGLGIRDQALDVGDRQVLVDRDRQRRLGDQRDRREVLDDVERRGLHRHRRRRERRGVEKQRVAVGAAPLPPRSAPIVPAPPGRLSTTKVWPVCSASFCASMRPTASSVPPGGNGMIERHRLGRIGLRPRAGEAHGQCSCQGRTEKCCRFMGSVSLRNWKSN